MANEVYGLHIQAIRVEQLLHGHALQVVTFVRARVLGVIILYIPAPLTQIAPSVRVAFSTMIFRPVQGTT